jgi:hypothetical protein
MKIEGTCHCGALAYEAEVDPAKAVICHCGDCQAFSGAPFRASVPAKRENLRFLKGAPNIYLKTADNGNRRAQAFCGVCGCQIYSSAAENPTLYMLRLGVVKQRAQIPAQRQIWCESALEWARNISGLPGVQGQS